MGFLKRNSKPLPRFGPAPSRHDRLAKIIAAMEPDRVYQVIDDDGTELFNGLRLKGKDWQRMNELRPIPIP